MKIFLKILWNLALAAGAVILSMFLLNMGFAAMTMPDDLSLVGGCMTVVFVAASWIAFIVRQFTVWREKFNGA